MWEWNDDKSPSRLIPAILKCDVELTKKLLAEGDDPNAKLPSSPENIMTVTPLGVAFGLYAYEGEESGLKIFDMLLEADANPDWLFRVADEKPADILDALNELRGHLDPKELISIGQEVLMVLKYRGIQVDMDRYYLTEEELEEGA